MSPPDFFLIVTEILGAARPSSTDFYSWVKCPGCLITHGHFQSFNEVLGLGCSATSQFQVFFFQEVDAMEDIWQPSEAEPGFKLKTFGSFTPEESKLRIISILLIAFSLEDEQILLVEKCN